MNYKQQTAIPEACKLAQDFWDQSVPPQSFLKEINRGTAMLYELGFSLEEWYEI